MKAETMRRHSGESLRSLSIASVKSQPTLVFVCLLAFPTYFVGRGGEELLGTTDLRYVIYLGGTWEGHY